MKFFLIVNTMLDKEESVAAKAREIPCVLEANPVFGAYDLIIICEGDTVEAARKCVNKVHRLSGVKSHLTLMEVDHEA